MYDTYVPELSYDDFYGQFYDTWQQGEHVVLFGITGTGKTTLASEILAIRDYVIVLAIKMKDETLNLFKQQDYRILDYKASRRLVIPYDAFHVVIRAKPRNIGDTTQAQRVYKILDKVFMQGGWCCYLDDTGYLTGSLGMKRPIVVLLSQARSHGTSVVAALVQPSSLTQGVPTETYRQVRHIFAWKYHDDPSIESIAKIAGINKNILKECMALLGDHDFLYIHDGQVTIVRNTRG